MTTAQLRTQAWDAYQEGRYSEAADLYEQALAAYPESSYRISDLARADVANLAAKVSRCRSMAGAA